MKFTLSWLKDHLDLTATLDELSETLTMIGLEVEEIIDRSETLAPFIVAEILEASPHPDADKLKVCRVNDGTTTRQIVCGASNARAGIKVVLATEGTCIPTNGMTIKPAKIRGVESNGMLCSEKELGLGDSHEGIMELPDSAKPGKPFAKELGLDDPIIDIAITPDRGDCLGVRGIARDLAAAGVGTLKPLNIPTIDAKDDSAVTVSLKDDGQSCRMFVGCTISGVKNGLAPDWLQQRLKAIGLRPISTLVDITNYITVDLGRPLHVYDIDKLNGNIHVRQSTKGEAFDALNDKQYELDAGATIIADGKGMLGLGGIVGGESSGCTDETTNVFLEVAWFDPIDIATTGRRYQIESDARYRFERTVDPAFLMDGATIATQMILDLCGGSASNLTIAGEAPKWKRTISFRPERVKALGGIDISAEDSKRILTALGCSMENTDKNNWTVTPPSWRPDIEGEADLVEEVLRINGLQHIPATPLPKPDELPSIELPIDAHRMNIARHSLAARGLREVRSWAFLHHDIAETFGGQKNNLRLANPISSELDTMRPSLIPNLLHMAKYNSDRGAERIHLCEIGLTYHDVTPDGQQPVAAMLRTGIMPSTTPHEEPRTTDLFDIKADALAALEACGAPVANLQISRDVPDYYHPTRSGSFRLGKAVLGYFGELHPTLMEEYDLNHRPAICELFLSSIPQGKAKTTRPSYNVSDLLPVERDFSFILSDETPSADLVKAIKGADKKLIQDVAIISTYQDDAAKSAGETSIALRVTLQPNDATLTEDDIDTVSEKIMAAALKSGHTRLSDALMHYAKEKNMQRVLPQ